MNGRVLSEEEISNIYRFYEVNTSTQANIVRDLIATIRAQNETIEKLAKVACGNGIVVIEGQETKSRLEAAEATLSEIANHNTDTTVFDGLREDANYLQGLARQYFNRAEAKQA